MCGIAGILNIDTQNADKAILKKMNSTMHHRGPDAQGYYTDRFLGFAHSRLSIIDLSGGNQPLSNENQTVWIIFNGEIYNFLEMKKLLESKGHIFSTHSDTETIVHLYEEYGEKCVQMLQGMFVFAIWDKNESSLFVARDRLGIKPLYYFFDGNKLIFASEIKAILEYGMYIPRLLDYEAVYDYLTFGFIPAPKTIFKHIKKLDSAHFIKLNMNNPCLKISQYWDISFAEKINRPENYFKEKIIESLTDSVSSHLISDVPLGAFLSGGIDSSAIVATMSKIIKEPVKTCSIGFENKNFSELPYAELTARLFNTDHSEYVVKPDAIDIIDKLLNYFDEPFADSSALPSYYLCKMTRQKVTVALSGDGGDENFAGYRRYIFEDVENRIRHLLPAFIRKPFFSVLGSIYPKADWLPQMLRAKTLFTNLAKDPFDAYFNTVSVNGEKLLSAIIEDEFRKKLNGYQSKSVLRKHYDKSDSDHYLDKVLYTEIKTFLPDDYLVKTDRASMANSLEVRVPLLDHKFMEFAAKIPAELKLKNLVTKYIFKKSLENILPREILYRKKQGFEIPVSSWIRSDLKNIFQETIFSKNSLLSSIVKKVYLEKIWNQHQTGIKDYGNNLWLFFILETWHKKYINN